MAEVIGALVEGLVALIVVIAEAIPIIIEALVYVVAGAFTVIGYALSRRFRERKQREWKERPKRKYLDLGMSSACLGLLAALAVWILLPGPRPASRNSSPPQPTQTNGQFRVVIGTRSAQGSNELTIAVKKDTITKFMQRRSHRSSDTNELEENAPAKSPTLRPEASP
jgi:hypothetical protein